MRIAPKPEHLAALPGSAVERDSGELSPTRLSHGLRVLLVAPDATDRDRIGGWLEGVGHEVLGCPGPGAPDYTCVGSRGGDCPLAEAADVVVLDLDLQSDAALVGTPSWQLLDYYVGRGHPVLAIESLDQIGRFFLDDRVVTLDRPVDRNDLLEAINYLSDRRPSVADIGTFRMTPRRRVHRPLGKTEIQTMGCP